ncbi:unnamed protein product [Danaus chrysippus]|uniref:(African queen) hypothetical protein n=1 Tax=Danaus chrysippus TaxID=151541 RepID=A0A8J2QMU2_9NEOP|nr:unnamed protein product [Danaus chrysippus]
MSVGRDIVLAAVRVVDRDIARVAVLRPQLITAVQRVVHAVEFEVKTVPELVIRRVMIVYATRNERNVDLCAENNSKNTGGSDIVVVVVDGIPMDAIIDSGALNVSLISSDVLRYLASQPKSTNCVLKGISEKEIVVKAYVNVTLELSQISIEANLLIVPSSCMNAPINAGTDILNRDGIMYIRTKDDQYLTRSTDSLIQINTLRRLEINTPLEGVMNRCLKS